MAFSNHLTEEYGVLWSFLNIFLKTNRSLGCYFQSSAGKLLTKDGKSNEEARSVKKKDDFVVEMVTTKQLIDLIKKAPNQQVRFFVSDFLWKLKMGYPLSNSNWWTSEDQIRIGHKSATVGESLVQSDLWTEHTSRHRIFGRALTFIRAKRNEENCEVTVKTVSPALQRIHLVWSEGKTIFKLLSPYFSGISSLD